MTSLEGKLIAITGAASGIGRATAELLAEKGARLSLADIDDKGLNELLVELQGKNRDEIYLYRVDVRDRDQVEQWIRNTVENAGGRQLDGAVNLAGISGQLATARDHSTSNYETVFAVNVAGTFNCMAAQLRNMRPSTKKTPGGSIVNAGSMAGLVGKTSASIYCASKHAVIGLTKAAAKEEATTTGIRVNAVAPGFVSTPMMAKLDVELGFQIPVSDALGARRAHPEEIAKLIAFLLSDDSSYTTGSVYQIDGGMVC